MFKELLFALQNFRGFLKKRSKIPWVQYEVVRVQNSEHVRVEAVYNAAFIEDLKRLGYTAKTDEELAEQFLFALVFPKADEFLNEPADSIESYAHPNLGEDSTFRRG